MYNNIQLPNGKKLGDILRFLPTRKIIYKFLTGCGATRLELLCKRHSILIEPYIPVILGKKLKKIIDKHGNEIFVDNPEVLAVYDDIKVKHIVTYLSQKRKYHKIVSTPEGLSKIADACTELGINMYTKFFLLVDECEKLIQDVDFRTGIVDVMHHFFKFNRRSFVSATPIAPTDPRFKEHNFDDFYINPEIKTLIDIDVYTTNNLASTIKNYFDKQKAEHYIIFVNSTERIASVINFLGIHQESQVFCSEKSVKVIKEGKKEDQIAIKNAQQHWDVEQFKKYNFFTSRFFTAFDMILKCTPNVLMISDVLKVAHSALDPNTDIIQIIGRAREGVNHIAHITNWNGSLQSKSEQEILSFLEGSHQAYTTIRSFRDAANNHHAKKVFNEALEMVTFHKFIDQHTGEISYFMKDNEVYQNRIRGYYQRPSYILNAYQESQRFNVNHIRERYNLDDESLKFLEEGLSATVFLKYICELFESHFQEQKANPFTLNPNRALYQLLKTHQDIYKYYRLLGIDVIRELEYSPIKINNRYIQEMIKNDTGYLQLQYSLLTIFKTGLTFSTNKIIRTLRFLYKRYNITLPATVKQLNQWIETIRTTVGYNNGKEVKEHRVIGSVGQTQLPLKFRQ